MKVLRQIERAILQEKSTEHKLCLFFIILKSHYVICFCELNVNLLGIEFEINGAMGTMHELLVSNSLWFTNPFFHLEFYSEPEPVAFRRYIK